MKLHHLAACVALAWATPSSAALWSTWELQYQHGRLDAPSFAGGGSSRTDIVTVQNATGWEYVDLFWFADFLDDNRRDGFNDTDIYTELYLGGGFGKLMGREGGFGPFRDIGWMFGVNHDKDAKVWKYLPGVRLYWDVPGFIFLNTDIARYIDDTRGVANGGAPKESDSWWIDVAWARPFDIGSQSFSFEGHMEFVKSRRNEFGGHVSSWYLAQPQLRWDAGKAFWGEAGHFFLGIEYQHWNNKLGDPNTDERAAQFLAVWRF